MVAIEWTWPVLVYAGQKAAIADIYRTREKNLQVLKSI